MAFCPLGKVFSRVLEIKDDSHSNAHIVTGSCIGFLPGMLFNDHFFLHADPGPPEKREVIFHLEMIFFIIFPADRNPEITAVDLG